MLEINWDLHLIEVAVHVLEVLRRLLKSPLSSKEYLVRNSEHCYPSSSKLNVLLLLLRLCAACSLRLGALTRFGEYCVFVMQEMQERQVVRLV